jgi:hypothetical protein
MKEKSENMPGTGQVSPSVDAHNASAEQTLEEDLLNEAKESRKRLFQFLMKMLSSKESE